MSSCFLRNYSDFSNQCNNLLENVMPYSICIRGTNPGIEVKSSPAEEMSMPHVKFMSLRYVFQEIKLLKPSQLVENHNATAHGNAVLNYEI